MRETQNPEHVGEKHQSGRFGQGEAPVGKAPKKYKGRGESQDAQDLDGDVPAKRIKLG